MRMVLGLIVSTAAAASDLAELPLHFERLRVQGLFRVAEEYALARLAEPDLKTAEQAILAVELSKVFASHAAESTTEANPLWARAEEPLTPLLGQPDNPRWGAVRTRQATLLSDRALSEFWKSQLAPDSESQHAAALSAVQTAIASLQSGALELKESRQVSSNKGRPVERRTKPSESAAQMREGALTTVEFRRLGDELDYLIIRMHLTLTQLLPVGADRAAALIEADTGSAALVRHVNSSFIWPGRFARAEAIRLQGDPEKAFTYAKSFLDPDLPSEISDALVAEQARAKLAWNAPIDGIELILAHGEIKTGPSRGLLAPELRAIVVECLLASIQATQDKGPPALTEDLWMQAAAQQQLITGPWRTYVDARLSRSRETRQYGEELATIMREGQQAAQRQDWPTAVAAYERATVQATVMGKTIWAAEFMFMQASIEIEAGQLKRAGLLLAEYQTRFPGAARAAEAHLLHAWTLGKLNDEKPSAGRRAEYVSQLQEHAAKFPGSSTWGEAQWSLAVDAIRNQEWIAAVGFLEAIPPEHARFSEAAVQLPYGYERGVAGISETSELQAWEQRAESTLRQQLASWPQPSASWTLSQSENALRWARVLLRWQDRRYAEADRLLSQIVNSREIEVREVARDGSALDPAWDRLMPMVTQLRIISLSGLGHMVEAEKLFHSETTTSAENLLAILSGLSDLASNLDEQSRRDLGRVQLAAARRLQKQRASLAPEKAGLVDRCLADAYVATGDLPEAILIYESLLKSSPRDRILVEAIGRLSRTRGQIEDLKRAKAIYRKLESFDPAGSPAWLRTRLTVAQVCFELGEKGESQKLLKVTQILYPELGSEKLRAEYEELAQRLAAGQ